jgi:hypothetical protein
MEFYNFVTGQTVTAQPWQLELKPGDYYCIETPGAAFIDEVGVQDLGDVPTVYGRIERADDEESFFLVRAYSQACPDGETGLMSACEPTRKLTEAEFEAARLAGWPAAGEPAAPRWTLCIDGQYLGTSFDDHEEARRWLRLLEAHFPQSRIGVVTA